MDLLERESGIDQSIHWYYQVKKIPLHNLVNKLKKTCRGIQVVDIGAGTGFFSIDLLQNFPDFVKKVTLVDINYSDEQLRLSEPSLVYSREIPKNIKDGLILMMDVLEHIEEPAHILHEVLANCEDSNNHFLITVPAFTSLWSYHDDYLGHFRRYTLKSLKSLLKSTGYQAGYSNYLFGSLFPIAFCYRKIKGIGSKQISSDMKKMPFMINRVLYLVLKFEALFFSPWNSYFGLSCLVVGKISENYPEPVFD